MKARKKPVVVEVYQLKDLSRKSIHEAMNFMGQPLKVPKGFNQIDNPVEGFLESVWKQNGLTIKTLENPMLASEGDYIIKGVNGEFYPCKPDIFEKTYELLEE